MRRKIIALLVLVLLTIALLELALSLFDPMGMRYVYQLSFMDAYYIGLVERYQLAPGEYRMGEWSATVQADTTRRVPGSGTGCRVAFFGDSVTWGWGVNDADTYVNQFAQAFPEREVVNAGQIAYNAQQIRGAIERTTFDRGVYLIIYNDASWPVRHGGSNPPSGTRHFPGFGAMYGQVSALRAYIVYLAQVYGTPDYQQSVDTQYSDWPAFWAALDAIAARGDMTLIAFDEPFGQQIAERVPVQLIPHYTSVLGRADGHPDKTGHAQIAQHIAPLITVCKD